RKAGRQEQGRYSSSCLPGFLIVLCALKVLSASLEHSMARRYLFGPVSAEFAWNQVEGPRRTGSCLAFNADGTTDLTVAPSDSRDAVCQRLPKDWRPEFVVLSLAYTTIPRCLWSAPVPVIGWAGDWGLLWHGYRRRLRCCDLVLTDAAGVQPLVREGIPQ